MKHIKVLLLSVLCLWIGINALYAQDTGDGVLPGEFSVSATEKVKFSQGNLQCKKKSEGKYEWRFASEQYERLDTLNSRIGQTGEWFDLFGYGASGAKVNGYTYLPEQTSLNSGDAIISNWIDLFVYALRWLNCYRDPEHCTLVRPDYATSPLTLTEMGANNPRKVDWGINSITNGGNKANLWHSLTSTQWGYLINDRSNAADLRKVITIQTSNGNVEGLLLLPDGAMSLMSGVTATISEQSWNQLETQGAVFLPAAGYRYTDQYYHRRTLQPTGKYKGYYWTASCSHTMTVASFTTVNPYAVHFDEGTDSVVIDYASPNYCGFSVRMARRINIPVTFKFNNGVDADTVIYVNYGDCVAAPTAVKRDECKVYTGTWKNYSATTQIFEPITYTAQYNSGTYINRTVRYLNYDSTVLETFNSVRCNSSGDYGLTPEPKCAAKNPTRPGDACFTYTFDGWNTSERVDKDTDYVATFTAHPVTYEVVFCDYNGDTLCYYPELPCNSVPTCDEPSRAATAKYSYTFKGWKETPVANANATYVAQYDSIKNEYEIVWKNWNGDTLCFDTITYGETPVYCGIKTPEKIDPTNEWTYTFKGWEPEVTSVTGEADYVATFDSIHNKYQVTWVNYNDTVLYKDSVIYGNVPVYPYADPECAATAQYTYEFSGWIPTVGPVTQDTVFKATYRNITVKYLVTWKNYNDTVLTKDSVEYGKVPSYTGETPTKNADAQFTYTFKGWKPKVDTVKGAQTYLAEYSETLNYYEVVYVNYNLTDTLFVDTLGYGSTPVYGGETPTKPADVQYTYQFIGWNPDEATVTGNALYVAEFDIAGDVKYGITWANYDGTKIYTDSLLYDDMPSYDQTGYGIPQKPSTDKYHFVWNGGWTPAVSNVKMNKTYTATFDTLPHKYEITWYNYDSTVLRKDSIIYDTMPVYIGQTPVKEATLKYTYLFLNQWNPAIQPVKKDTGYVAVFDSLLNSYKLVWKNWNDTILHASTRYYGDTIIAPADPVRTTETDSVYFFIGWMPDPVEVSHVNGIDTMFVAQYESKPRYYDVTIVLEDSTTHITGEYDSVPDLSIYQTTFTHCDSTYTFKQWAPAIAAQDTTPITYTAVYNVTQNLYTMTWLDSAGVHTYRQPYDSVLRVENTLDSVWKDNFIWLFDGWDPTPESFDGKVPCKDTTFVAQYHSIPRYYDVTYIYRDENESGEWDTLTTTHQYGDILAPDSLTSEKWYCDSTHIFQGWDPALVSVNDTSVKTFTAVYNDTLNLYTMTWTDSAGVHTYRQPYDSALTIQNTLDTVWKDNFIWLFDGWDPTPESLNGVVPCQDTTFVAQYHNIPRYYDVTYIYRDENESGEWDTLTTTHQYGDILAPDSLTSEKWYCDSTHIFQGWDPALVSVNDTSVKTFTAVYNDTLNLYTMTWLDSAGVHTYRQPYDSLLTIQQTNDSVWKDNFIWLFDGWNPTPESLNGVVPCQDTTFVAQYHNIPRYYDVTYIYRDENESGDWDTLTTTHQYGDILAPDSLTSEKWYCDSTHIFQGWDPALVSVNDTSVKTFTAVYNDTLNLYTMTWTDSAGVHTYRQPYDSALTIQNTLDTVWKDNFIWLFDGWNPTPESLNGVVPCQDTTFVAQYHNIPRYYDVTYIYRDENESGEWDTLTTTHQYGDILAPDSLTSEKWYCDSTHIFQGWDPALVSVNDTSVKTFTAVYNDTLNLYTMTWLDSAGVHTYRQPYDSLLTIQQTNDSVWKDNFIWLFDGWDPTPESLNTKVPCEDTTFVAQYHSIPRYYDVTYIYRDENESGEWDTIVASQRFGDILTPDSLMTDKLYCDSTHIFSGWNPALQVVDESSSKIFVAQYTDIANLYNVVWKNWNGTILHTDVLEYQDPIMAPANPARPTDGTNVYFFAGWTPDPATELTNVPCRDTVFVAQYTSAPRYYDVTIVLKDSTTHIVGEYDSVPDLSMYETTFVHCDSTYAFNYWTPSVSAQGTTAVTYTAVYTVSVNKYYVTWNDENGSTLRIDTLECGNIPSFDCIYRDGGDSINYHFTGWTPAVAAVTSDAVYTASFEYTERIVGYDATLNYVKCTGDTLTLPSGAVINVLADGTVNDTVYLAARKPYEGMSCYNNDSLVDVTVYTITFANYKNPLEGALNITCVDEVVQGMSINLTQTQSDIMGCFLGNYDELIPDWDNSEWQIMDGSGNWVAYQGTEIRDHEVGDIVYIRYVIPTNCEDIIFSLNDYGCDMSVHQANADNCPDCQNDAAVIAVYDWLLMYEHARMQSEGYNVTPDKVYWYSIGGDDWDNLNDWTIPYAIDDQYLGNGYYYTINKAFNGNGDYYALIDVTGAGSRALPCLGIMRSQKFHYMYAPANIPAASLYPSEVRNSDIVYLVGLQGGIKNDVYVYDMAGKLVSHDTVTEDHYEFHAAGAAGTYRVVVITENNKQTLSFIIL